MIKYTLFSIFLFYSNYSIGQLSYEEQQARDFLDEIYYNAEKILGKSLYELQLDGKPYFVNSVSTWELDAHNYQVVGDLSHKVKVGTKSYVIMMINISSKTGKACQIEFVKLGMDTKSKWIKYLGKYFYKDKDYGHHFINDNKIIYIKYYESTGLAGVTIMLQNPSDKTYYYVE